MAEELLISLCKMESNLSEITGLIAAFEIDNFNLISRHDEEGHTALTAATEFGNLDVVKFLTECTDIDPSLSSRDMQRTALHYAIQEEFMDVVQYLVEVVGVDIHQTDEMGQDGLYVASLHGEQGLYLMQYLINAGANVHHKNIYGATMIHKNDLEVIRYLVDGHGLDPNEANDFGYTPLMSACFSGYEEVVQYLVEEKSVDVETRCDEEMTALMYAVCNDNLQIVEYLFENAHAQVNAVNKTGMTAVMFAVRQRNFEVLQYLVEYCGAEIHHRNQTGQTAMEMAQEMNLEMIAYYLYKQSPLSMHLEYEEDDY